MPIDPNIPGLAVRNQPEPFNLLGTIADVQSIKYRQALAQKAQREEQDQEQMHALAAQYPDPEDFVREYGKVNPEGAQKVAKLYEEAKASKLKTHSDSLKLRSDLLDYRLRTLQAADTPQKYGLWRKGFVSEAPEWDQQLPTEDQWTPEVNTKLMTVGDTLANSIKNEHDTAAAFMEGKYRAGLAKGIADSPTVDVARSLIEKARGFAPKADIAWAEGVLAASPSFDVARQTFAQSTVSEKERQDLALRTEAEKRQAAQDAASQAIARGNLAVSQGQLGVARGNLQQRIKEGTQVEGGGDPGELVAAIMKNPAIYGTLTPAAKTKIAVPLAKAGFKDWEKADGKKGGSVEKILGEIDTLSKQIFTQGPLLANAVGSARYATSKANYDNAVSEYHSLVESMTPMVARAMGHTGVLTQQDVESAQAAFPVIGYTGADNKELAANKMARVYRLIGADTAAGGNQPQHKVGEVVTVKGKKVQITKVLPDGTFEGVAIP